MASAAWFTLDREAGDLEGQIYRHIRERILSGHLQAGQRLPSTRGFGDTLGVSRSTVVDTYERLKAEGYMTAQADVEISPWQTTSRPAPWHGSRNTGNVGGSRPRDRRMHQGIV